MPDSLTRRTFLASSAATLAAAQLAAAPAGSPPTPATTQARKLKVGIVGVGGRGFNHVKEVSGKDCAEVVALCDVDAVTLVNAARTIPKAAVFVDFRDMLKMPGLEAVVVSTPDHTHAVAIAAAMKAGKHVYSEKPLCHTIKELRAIVALAKETGLVTQTGIQMHAGENYRRVVEIVQSGAIGPVREVHVWHNRERRPFSRDVAPPPAQLNYDLWLGPAAMRPFKKGFHPYSWRQWWAFGDAQLGDQGCHFLDVVFWSLWLEHPTRISATGDTAPEEEMVCNRLVARYEYPARGSRPAVVLNWYDNPHKPKDWGSWKLDKDLADEAVMFVGDDGMLCTNYQKHQLLPAEKFADFKLPATTLPRSPGHTREWINACLANDPSAASAPFSYGALLTETCILGTLAYRAGKMLEWDAANLGFPNAPEMERLLGAPSREGWTV